MSLSKNKGNEFRKGCDGFGGGDVPISPGFSKGKKESTSYGFGGLESHEFGGEDVPISQGFSSWGFGFGGLGRHDFIEKKDKNFLNGLKEIKPNSPEGKVLIKNLRCHMIYKIDGKFVAVSYFDSTYCKLKGPLLPGIESLYEEVKEKEEEILRQKQSCEERLRKTRVDALNAVATKEFELTISHAKDILNRKRRRIASDTEYEYDRVVKQ